MTKVVGKLGWGIIVKTYQCLTFQLKNDYICILILKKHQKLILDKMVGNVCLKGFTGYLNRIQFLLLVKGGKLWHTKKVLETVVVISFEALLLKIIF